VEELLELSKEDNGDEVLREKLTALKNMCLQNTPTERPLFRDILHSLSHYQEI